MSVDQHHLDLIDAPMPIITPRLHLRPRTRADIDAIHTAKLAMKQPLRQWMQWASEDQFILEATTAFVEKAYTCPREALDGLAGFHRETGDLVVMTGLRRRPEKDSYCTGYWVSAPYLRQGYASEACNAMIRYAFGALNAEELQIDHFVGNAPSQRVIEKMGFTYTHTVPNHMLCHATGQKTDVRCYVRRDSAGLPDLDVNWG